MFLFHEKMAQFEENSILREFLDVFQNGTPARLALFGVAQSEALLYIDLSFTLSKFNSVFNQISKITRNNIIAQF